MCCGAVDLGTTYVKTHLGDIFPSGISTTIHNLSNNVMTLDNKQYSMEQLYNYDTNSDKSLNYNIRLNFIYALHKLANDNNSNFKGIVINTPATQWKDNSNINNLKRLLQIQDVEIDVNGISKIISVEEIVVMPEDSAIYYTPEINNTRFNKRRVLIIGLGSWNMNTILFENDEIIDLDTDELGCLRLFKDMTSVINTKYNSNIKIEQMLDIYNYGLRYKDKVINIKEDLQDILFNYAEQIYKLLKIKWSIDNIPFVLFAGGGSLILQEYLHKYIPQIELTPSPQILSAKGMGIIARMCFE